MSVSCAVSLSQVVNLKLVFKDTTKGEEKLEWQAENTEQATSLLNEFMRQKKIDETGGERLHKQELTLSHCGKSLLSHI